VAKHRERVVEPLADVGELVLGRAVHVRVGLDGSDQRRDALGGRCDLGDDTLGGDPALHPNERIFESGRRNFAFEALQLFDA